MVKKLKKRSVASPGPTPSVRLKIMSPYCSTSATQAADPVRMVRGFAMFKA